MSRHKLRRSPVTAKGSALNAMAAQSLAEGCAFCGAETNRAAALCPAGATFTLIYRICTACAREAESSPATMDAMEARVLALLGEPTARPQPAQNGVRH